MAKAGWGRVVVLCGLVLAAPDVRAGTLMSPGCLDGGDPATVAGIEPPFDLRMTDGRKVRLAGLDPGSDRAADIRESLGRWLVGHGVRVVPTMPAADRWGRTPALVFAADSADHADRFVSVGEALLDAGLAVARPGDALAPCWAPYLRLEAEARAARRGLWAASSEGVIAATDTPALEARRGTFVVVEGTVAAMREGRARTYLRFAGVAPGGMAVSLDRAALARLGKAGIAPAAWLGRALRVRGVLDDRWGLQIELSRAEQVEVIGP